jgi:GT2 family glycosyltransferase
MSALVSVLMPCYRDFHLVERSLPRILEGSRCDLEVVLLNNDSGQVENMHDLVHGLGDSRVRLLELEDKAGFIKAINAGIGATTGELVFFANSDLFVADGYLDEMVTFFERRPRAACATGKILRYEVDYDRETDIIDTTGHTIGRNRRVVDRGENERDVGQYEREEQVFGVSGAALVVRRDALESIRVRGEYLDESFDMYKDDIDLCWRLRLAGWECWHVPSAIAYHARTSAGLGSKSYLSSLRAFHEAQKRKSRRVRINSMKNQWLILVKNDDLTNLARDLPFVLGREALILGHNALFAPRQTVCALRQFFRALPGAWASRQKIKQRQSVPPSEIRRWFTPESHPS